MSKPPKVAYELSDAEKRDLTQLIQQGKPLPEKYRFILFEDKREVELVWNGKTRDVCTTVLPFQSLEHVDEPRKEAPEMQSDLFDTRGRQLIKVSKGKDGVVTRDTLTKHWADWVDYWAVDFDYMSRKEIIKVAVGSGIDGVAVSENPHPNPPPSAKGADKGGSLTVPSPAKAGEGEGGGAFEERWTGSYIFENEWQSFRTRKNRDLEFISAPYTYTQAGRYTVAVKVIDIFGNDTMVLVPVSVG